MACPPVTVVVTQREGFSRSLPSLESLLATTSRESTRIVYVDSGSPRQVRDGLARAAERSDFTLIRVDHLLTQNQARLLAFERVTTDWVVFVDNDVFFEPGWLDALVRCGEETGASIVGPIYAIGNPDNARVHSAGGRNRIIEGPGGRGFEEHPEHQNEPVADVRPHLQRQQTEGVEFHCMLVRRAAIRDGDGIDTRLISVLEHNDTCLRVRRLGGTVWLEPAALVTYWPAVQTIWDRLYFLWRWRQRASADSVRAFSETWDLPSDGEFATEILDWTRFHRWRALRRPHRLLDRVSTPVAGWWGGRRRGSGEPQLVRCGSWDVSGPPIQPTGAPAG